MDLELLIAQWGGTVPPSIVRNIGLATCSWRWCSNLCR